MAVECAVFVAQRQSCIEGHSLSNNTFDHRSLDCHGTSAELAAGSLARAAALVGLAAGAVADDLPSPCDKAERCRLEDRCAACAAEAKLGNCQALQVCELILARAYAVCARGECANTGEGCRISEPPAHDYRIGGVGSVRTQITMWYRSNLSGILTQIKLW